MVLLKNDFSWNWAIRIGELVSTFRCWQFSPSSFSAQKNTTKKLIFLCLIFTRVNSSQKEINVPFWCKKESHFDRCMYRGFLFLHLFHCFWKVCVLRVPYVIVFEMQKILYLFWFLEVIFGLPGALLCFGNILKSAFLSKLQISFTDFVICLCFQSTEWDFLLK